MSELSRRGFIALAAASAVSGVLLPRPASAKWQDIKSPLPQLALTALNGGEIRLKSLAGRVVLVNFWATWCPPCIDEFLDLVHLQHLYKNRGLTVVAANLGESSLKIRKFLQQLDISESEILIGLDNASMTSKKWGVRAVPTTFLIDRRGQPRKVWTGEINADDAHFISAVEALLG